MTKNELIKEIAKKVEEIQTLYYDNYQSGNNFSMYFSKDSIYFNNRYYDEDKDFKIDYRKTEIGLDDED